MWKIHFEDEVWVLLLIGSILNIWIMLFCILKYLGPDCKLTLEMVKNNMLNADTRKKKKGENDNASFDVYVHETDGKI